MVSPMAMIARCIALAGSGNPCDMKYCCKSASRLRVADSTSDTDGVMMAEWNCSRLVKNVSIAAVPIAPPRLRIMLNRPDAPPASCGVIPSIAIAESGVITIA